MDGKLIKTENGYGLKDCELIAFVSSRRPEHKHHKLSLKNCQAIELGYDLDGLVDEVYPVPENSILPIKSMNMANRRAFKGGFQKALSILGDKKFSEENLEKAFDLGKYVEREDCTENYLAYKQSLQQTEWDVTFDFEKKDAEGRLILKRK